MLNSTVDEGKDTLCQVLQCFVSTAALLSLPQGMSELQPQNSLDSWIAMLQDAMRYSTVRYEPETKLGSHEHNSLDSSRRDVDTIGYGRIR